MLVKCWYTVLKFRLNFGSLDMLHRLILHIHNKYKIPAEISETDLKEFLFKLNDPELDKGINDFIKYVPYRFLSPFYVQELRGRTDAAKNRLIEELSCRDDKAPYRIISADSKLEVNYNWFEYLYCNMAIITG